MTTPQEWTQKFKEQGMTPEQAMAFLEKMAAEGNPHAIAELKRIKAKASAKKETAPR